MTAPRPTPIDDAARDRLALALRRLASGRITNAQFDAEIEAFISHRRDEAHCECGYDLTGLAGPYCPECGRSADLALSEIALFGWSLYSDLSTYRLRGRNKLPPEHRRAVARAVLFLKSDLPYRAGLVFGERPDKFAQLWTIPLIASMVAMVAGGLLDAHLLMLFGGGMLIALCIVAALWSAAARLVSCLRGRGTKTPEPGPSDGSWPFSSVEEFEKCRRHGAPAEPAVLPKE